MEQYVGQTSNNLNTRLRTHISDINTKKIDKPVPDHFDNGTCDITHVQVSIIDRHESRDINNLLRKEEAWIRYLRSVTPCGLNFKPVTSNDQNKDNT